MSVSSIPAVVKESRAQNESEGFLSRLITDNVDDLKNAEMWRGCFAECVGVFFLAFFTIGVGISKDGDPPASLLQVSLGVGFFITIIISCLSTVSGGHVNPAISIGFLVTNQITFVRFVFYSIFQVVGAVVGTLALQAVLPAEYEGGLGLFQPGEGVTYHQAMGMEMVITALLLFGTMSFIDKHREDVQGSIPLMVGLTVSTNVLAAGKISGASMNPARALGPAVILGNMDHQWIYWIGPMVGGAVGAWFYDAFFSTRPLSIISRLLTRSPPMSRYQPTNDDDEEAVTQLDDVSVTKKLHDEKI